MKTINTFAPSRPHKGQKAVLASLDAGQRFVLLRAGRKWRKTSLMISWLFEMAGKTGLVCPYVAPSRVMAKNIAWSDHVKRILNEFKNKGVSYKTNETELSVTLPNGGKVMLMGVENEEALRGISNWGAFCGDEIDDWEAEIWSAIVRPNLMVHKAQAILGGTPKGFRFMFSLEQNPDFKTFYFTSHDNPDLDAGELEALEKEYKQLGQDYYEQEILANYTKPVGTVYKEWDLNRQYLDIPYDETLPLYVTFDFGVNDPTSIVWIQPYGSETRVIDYYEASDANIEHFVSIVNAKPYKKPDLFTGDHAGNQRSLTTGTSPIQILRQKGIYLRTTPGIRLEEQIRQTHAKIPGLFVSTKAERFKDCLINYRYPTKRDTNFNQSNELPIHDEWSHGMRAFEYWVINSANLLSHDRSRVLNTVLAHNQQSSKDWSMG